MYSRTRHTDPKRAGVVCSAQCGPATHLAFRPLVDGAESDGRGFQGGGEEGGAGVQPRHIMLGRGLKAALGPDAGLARTRGTPHRRAHRPCGSVRLQAEFLLDVEQALVRKGIILVAEDGRPPCELADQALGLAPCRLRTCERHEARRPESFTTSEGCAHDRKKICQLSR